MYVLKVDGIAVGVVELTADEVRKYESAGIICVPTLDKNRNI